MTKDKTKIDESEKELQSVEESNQVVNDDSEIHIESQNDFAKNLFPIIEEYKQKLVTCEDNLQRALADYQNLEKRSQTDIHQRVLQKTNQLMLNFIGIYEDFIRAKIALTSDGVNTEGLNGIIKNMEVLLTENNIKQIDTKGQIFDPKLHEAVSTMVDNSLEEGTITQEVTKGYISFHEVIKPSKVIVSKKM
jgi:molecular chaperone GrpE